MLCRQQRQSILSSTMPPIKKDPMAARFSAAAILDFREWEIAVICVVIRNVCMVCFSGKRLLEKPRSKSKLRSRINRFLPFSH